MADAPSRLDLYNVGRDYLLQLATKIDPNVVDTLGSDANIFVGSQSEVAYAVVLQLLYAVNRLLLDGAEADDLDRYALDRYGGQVPRKGAAPALGAVTLSRPTATAGPGTVPTGTTILSTAGFQYITTGPGSFTNGGVTTDLVVPNVPVRAVQAGTSAQASVNTLTRFANPAANFDPTITINNPITTSGSADPELDEVYRERIRSYWLTARRGILAAIMQGATQVVGVASAQAVEVIGQNAQPVRLVNLYIADASGVANAQLAQLVQNNLSDYRAAGIQVVISTSIPTIVSIVLHLTFLAGADTVTLSTQVQAAVVNYCAGLAVNQTLTIAALNGVLTRFAQQGLIVDQSSIVAPVGDLVPALGTTLRATTASVSLA